MIAAKTNNSVIESDSIMGISLKVQQMGNSISVMPYPSVSLSHILIHNFE